MDHENKKQESNFWKGDPFTGFILGAIVGLIVGSINIATISFPWLGRLCFLGIWLFVGTQPRFKDKRTPEQIAKDKEERDQKFEEIREQAKAREAERQATKEQKREAKMQKNELKLQKNQLKIQKHQLKNRSKIKCPKCRSTNVQPLGVHKKGFSVGKAVGGTILVGGVGSLAGFAGKRSKKTDFVCMNCGKQFKK
ncbi:hypothetical protein LMB68_03255 [Limosilactobacillus reuteri]|uniref:hypothetical protein n=1 Tax=Limosilactobacillus reuteri TaxID=1598 RepID=UPI001E446714|nr:hypothetical protein [Limosilactobacillus reuteri]MCC4413347.1 hypothetical protein [Limosilactobacillus reuteri]MDK8117542.1 hypothetical protein [Limosilactobacillus reuteri]